ncbi:hypothetical protein G9A89_022725 [Geosiphon pyriformis]|nr:hypothetical protein G9A89_022725 [Geosiphon pyriformis]
MGACISPEEEYETHTCYFCKTCHRERFGSSKRSGKWDNTSCLTYGEMLPEECNWIDVAMRGGVCDQTCQYALSISEKCLECYALSIPLPDENDENEIEFEISKLVEKLPTTPIYLLEKQPSLQLKYFDNHGQEIRPEKAHEIDAEYDLRYPGKDTLSLTKINLKIALEIPLRAIVQIAFKSSLSSKGINIRGGVIDAEYTEDITIMLQNETDKPFKIEHAEKIAQAIYLPLINISGL